MTVEQRISVDVMDDQESEKLAFARGGAELMRTKVAPESDAFTFATIAAMEGISKLEGQNFTDAVQFLEALIDAKIRWMRMKFRKKEESCMRHRR